jgi:hypothetical protein
VHRVWVLVRLRITLRVLLRAVCARFFLCVRLLLVLFPADGPFLLPLSVTCHMLYGAS